MMDIHALQQQFAASRFLSFDQNHGLTRAHIKTEHASATIYLQGAHLTAWQPATQQPVIFLSRKSEFAPGKPIRGGVPVAFPWFATDTRRDRIDGHPGPSHGFARIEDWTLTTASRSGQDAVLTFELGPTELSRSMGFDHFRLGLTFTIGREITMALTVRNEGEKPLTFEEALHSYFCVTDIHEVSVSGLELTSYLDKTDEFKGKPASQAPIRFTGMVDRVYENTRATCTIDDATVKRRVTVRKSNSDTTIVWNPWKEMPDLGPWEWHEMVAVETANAGKNAVTLAPGASHTMSTTVSVEKA